MIMGRSLGPAISWLTKRDDKAVKLYQNLKQIITEMNWCPDTASKAYIDTVKSCKIFQESSVAELIAAMAAGWNAKLIVEAWWRGGVVSTSIGLAVASRHTQARHVCVVPDELSRSEYMEAMMREAGISPEVMVGEAEEVMQRIPEVDFLVVDCRRKDYAGVLRKGKLSPKGGVLVCKHANPQRTFRWRSVLTAGTPVVRTVFLPVGKGLDIAHVGSSSTGSSSGGTDRWIRYVDQESGEEHIFSRRMR
ncbi:hypothetical protein NE237_012810 [Protea cynaroides]|uniref:S-adenosyl-L-methionine-dependent methyltransferase n=1 Tax=Protea cynaroides TaxID=273540 RepID=A0A9Q0JYF0_9MAGN|nr:hypothetical protein NE237_012810 [Protea cynaroides]